MKNKIISALMLVMFLMYLPSLVLGYEGKEYIIDFFSLGIIMFSIISTAFAGFLWKIYGKDDEIIENIYSYPPEGFNSLEIAWIYNGETNEEMVASLILGLANKGYLEVSDNGVYDTKIFKLKEYDGNNEIEKLFFEGLFNTINNKDKDYIEISELKNGFFSTYDEIKHKLDLNKGKLFESNTKEKEIWSKILSFLIIILNISKMVFENIGLATFKLTAINIITIAVSIICIILLFIFVKIMPKRTKYGNELLGKIIGFIKFIKETDKEKFEEVLKENSNYFNDILPYTYSLGISNKFITDFEKLSIDVPKWYKANNMTFINFNSFIKYTMKTISVNMSSISNSNEYNENSEKNV